MQSPASVIVIGGASCAGKSTLANRLLAGALSEAASALGLEPGDDYHLLYGLTWSRDEASRWPRLLIQYDITARTPFAEHGVISPEALEWLRRQQVVLLTVWEQPAELERRLKHRFEGRGGLAWTVIKWLVKGYPRKASRSLRRYLDRRRLYRSPDDLWALHRAWFDSSAQLDLAPHWLMQSTRPGELRLLTGDPMESPMWEKAAVAIPR
jgi:hypothetical protein